MKYMMQRNIYAVDKFNFRGELEHKQLTACIYWIPIAAPRDQSAAEDTLLALCCQDTAPEVGQGCSR